MPICERGFRVIVGVAQIVAIDATDDARGSACIREFASVAKLTVEARERSCHLLRFCHLLHDVDPL
jgi:hypothetical protein